jgi:UDP-N-acetylmuramoyl-L-alanyl-D-glutamate--2,6-diaminopimelate ligase
MLLRQLFGQIDPSIQLEAPDLKIGGVCDDSRQVKPGYLFVARAGTRTAGSQFVEGAIKRGAIAIVSSARIEGCRVPQIVVEDPAEALSRLAQVFFGQPTGELRVVGVTGTNGKTTTAYLVRHLLNKSGLKCGMIGTVDVDDGKTAREAMMTTPGAVEIASLFATMRDNGCAACAMEVSSHALDQKRVAGIRFAGAGFTNLTGDHLDYHQTMDNYARAKSRLFEMLPDDAVAVVNADDQASNRMVAGCKARVVRFSVVGQANYSASRISITSQGSRFILRSAEGQIPVELGLIGRHNVANALTAAALVHEVFGLPLAEIAANLADAEGAPGRLQAVRAGQPFTVVVDYAHTDDALENVLTALRPLTPGKLRVLFGCGGDRDRTKRPRMAKIAAKLADVVYVTSDNPRTENPKSIVEEILAGIPKGKKPVYVELDRRAAIEKAVGDAGGGDVLLLAGKGHENYQIVGTTKHHFDDVEEAKRVLEHGSEHSQTP